MKAQLRTEAIVLTRVEYGEADRILTVLTPHKGKISLIARGARRVKSKLAGGIELFSINELVYSPGRGNLAQLMSARLIQHYSRITHDIDRTMLGYDLIKLLHKVTEDEPEEEYYNLLARVLAALNNSVIPPELIRVWFDAQLLRLAGNTPNLLTTKEKHQLDVMKRYTFDYDAMAFQCSEDGSFGANEIKILRLLFAANDPVILVNVLRLDEFLPVIASLLVMLRQLQLRV